MDLLRAWLPSVLAGIAMPLLGLGIVSALPLTEDARAMTRPVRPVSRPAPAPASVEAFVEPVVTPSPPPRRSEPHPAPMPKPEPERSPDPTPEPVPAPPAPAPPAPAAPVPPPAPPPVPVPAPAAPAPVPPPEPPPVAMAATVPAPVLPPPPAAPPPPPPPAISLPAQVFDVTRWKLTLPVGPKDHPIEVRQPALATFTDPEAFRVDPATTAVVFRARAGGVTTKHSDYPRSELREMTPDGLSEAAWSNASGTHVMTITEAITALPAAKPHVVAGQVHDADDDVIMIRLERDRLFVEADGHDAGVLDPAYRLGTRFTVEIAATPAGIRVTYNGTQTVNVGVVRDGLYFKAGCYTQSNPSRGDQPDAFGEVAVYGLTVSHT